MNLRLAVLILLVITGTTLLGSDRHSSWLDKDVRWIITEPEHLAFLSLKTDAERDEFIVRFWQRRDHTPETSENEFKQEHYRRIAYANEHFTSKQEGALTDRGEIYIKYGPPDEIVRDSGKPRLAQSLAPQDQKPPAQLWIYRALGKPPVERTFRFVDSCSCGDFQLKDEPVIYDPVR